MIPFSALSQLPYFTKHVLLLIFGWGDMQFYHGSAQSTVVPHQHQEFPSSRTVTVIVHSLFHSLFQRVIPVIFWGPTSTLPTEIQSPLKATLKWQNSHFLTLKITDGPCAHASQGCAHFFTFHGSISHMVSIFMFFHMFGMGMFYTSHTCLIRSKHKTDQILIMWW